MSKDKRGQLGKKIYDGDEVVYLTPREIWEIAKEFEPTNYYREYFGQLEQGIIQEMWYRGAKLIRRVE